MLKPISRMEEAFRDTTLHKVQGTQIDRVGSMFGFPRPAWLVKQYWRDAFAKTAYSPRGVSQTLFRFLRFALQQLEEKFTVTVASDTPDYSVTASSAVFTNKHVGRLCILKDSNNVEQVFLSELVPVLGPFVSSQVHLRFAPTSTSLFNACPQNLAQGTYTLTILPFQIHELTPSAVYPTPTENADGVLQGGSSSIPSFFLGDKKNACLIRVRLFNTTFDVPGSFVQKLEDLDALEEFVPPAEIGGPTGGYLMNDVSVTQYNAGDEQFPIYLGEGVKNANLIADILRQSFLAAAVRVEFELFALQDFD